MITTQSSITLKPSQLSSLLSATIPAHEPVLVTGMPGIGKTDIVKAGCAAANADCIIMHPVVSDPTDFKGMPWVGEDGATFLPFGELKKLMTATKLTACFFDDLGQAGNSVQAAVMQLLLARQINGHAISEHVVFLAATNRRNDRAGVSGILEPVKSRFGTIVELVTDLEDWCAWATRNRLAPEIIAYIRSVPKALCEFMPTADMTNSPNPRTWFAASRQYRITQGLSKEVQRAALIGAVGEARGVELVGFLRHWQKMVNPDLVLTAPDTAPIPTDEPSAMYALMIGLGERVKKATMERYTRYLDRVMQVTNGQEYAAASMKYSVARDPMLTNTPAYITAMSGPLGTLMVGG